MESDNAYYAVDEQGALYNKEYSKLLMCPGGKAEFYIPQTVTSIEIEAFAGSAINSINIPNSVTNIGSSAFYGCGKLTTVTFGSSVTSIESSAFHECKNIILINSYNTTPPSCNYAFDDNVYNNATVYVPKESLDEYKRAWSKFVHIEAMQVDVPVSALTLPDSVSIEIGKTMTIEAVITPEDATNKVLTWQSSDNTVTKVDSSGNVTALAIGTAIITASTTDDSKISTSCKISVFQLVSDITLDETSITLNEGQTKQLTATVFPEQANNTTLAWSSSNEAVATVDQTGLVTAKKRGTTIITATATDGSEVYASCQIIVHKLVADIALNETEATLNEGQTVQLIATVTPGHAYNKKLAWSSSNEAVATVDQTGLVTAISQGSAIITATATDGSEVYASCQITVHKLVADITLNETEATLNEGQTVQLIATVSPELADNTTLIWNSSNDDVATVDQTGLVTAISQGSAIITATATDGSEVYASCQIIVHKLVADIALNETEATLNEGQTVQLIATVSPELADNTTLIWNSSNDDVATVDQTGLVTAISQGSAIITATATDGSEVTATCNITVIKLVSGITLSFTDLTLAEGQLYKLDANISPETANNKILKWISSNESIAAVDQEGNVTAITQGTAVITASTTDGSEISASCNVTVVKLVSGITLSESEIALSTGEYKILEATVFPTDATNTSIIWETTDATVASVENGVIFAIADGEATITATATDGSNLSASCHVTVRTLVSEIVLDKADITLKVGEFTSLNATVYPDNATNSILEWSSSDESIVSIMNGLVLAHAEGTATITASATDGSGIFAECTITVSNNSDIDNISISNLCIFVENSTIYCKNVPAKTVVRIYQLDGTELFVGESDGSLISFRPANYGMYLVVIKNIAERVVIK